MSKLPASLMASLTNIKGFNKEAFEAVHASGEQVTSVRVNGVKSKWETIDDRRQTTDEKQQMALASHVSPLTSHDNASPVPWCPYGFYLPSRPSFTFDPFFHAGTYYVQEASSMFLWEVLKQTIGDNSSGLKVLDLCAAPGGKSTLLASYFTNGLVVANEVIRQRAAILVENITKWGADNTVVTNNDPKDFAGLEGYFDVMVVDAPCSGSGLFRRDDEAINEWSEDNVTLCSQRQQRILADAYTTLKSGGVLIYSTCSYSKQEDEDILDWICEQYDVENIRLHINSEWGITETESDKHKAYGYRFYPYKVKGEGFFIAAFKKKDGFTKEHRVQGLPKITKEEAAAVAPFISDAAMQYFKQGENIVAIQEAWKNEVAILQKHLYLRKAGITAGALKGRDMVPAHELAMSTLADEQIARIPLTAEQAIQYLQKKEIQAGNFTKGWALATYRGTSLGWVKVLPNRVNNYYPVEWRILKQLP